MMAKKRGTVVNSRNNSDDSLPERNKPVSHNNKSNYLYNVDGGYNNNRNNNNNNDDSKAVNKKKAAVPLSKTRRTYRMIFLAVIVASGCYALLVQFRTAKQLREDTTSAREPYVDDGSVVKKAPSNKDYGAAMNAGPAATVADDTRRADVTPNALAFLEDNKEQQEKNAFGGCLMIMDDNHFLAEWLAYHWFMMPLRHLVVYIDQKSRTSPIPILERFKDYISFDVVDWSYPDAYSDPPPFLKDSIHADPVNRKLIGEQLKFYEDCMRWYSRQGWTSWISLHDTDEFVSINPHARYPGTKVHLPNVPDNTEPGNIMKWLRMTMKHRLQIQQQEETSKAKAKTATRHDKESRTYMGFTPCLGVPRMQFCLEEDEPTTKLSSKLGLQDKDFSTLRWSSFPKGKEGTRAPKDFVHIGGINTEYFEKMNMLKNGARPHEVIPDRCEWHQLRLGSPFQIYHYSGTKEQRQFRVDPRGQFGTRPGSPPADQCPEEYSARIIAKDIRVWLQAFIDAVGEKEAKRLLQNVGNVHGWPKYEGPTSLSIGKGIAAASKSTR